MRRLIALVLLWPTLALGNPLDAFGFGARAMAMGSAATAISADSFANYYNPAGLAHAPHLRLDLGYALLRPALRIGEGDQNVDDSRGFQGGVVLPGELFGRKIGFSIGLHLPDERVSRVRALPQRQPRWVLWDNRPQRVVISSSVGFEVIEGLSLGAGLTYLANTGGTLDITGDVGLFDVELTTLTSAVDVNLAAVRYWTVGARFDRGPLRLGAVWRQDFSLRLDLDVRVTGRILTAPGVPIVPEGLFLLNSANDNLYSPQQVVLGAAWQGDGWLIAVDVGWLDWSAFPSPTATVTLTLDVAPVPANVPLPAVPADPDFHDIFVPRVGGELTLLDGPLFGLVARAGYFYEPSPAPDQPGDTNYVDADKHAVAAGLGLRFTDPSGTFPQPLHLDIAGQYIRVVERTYHKTDPADPIGDYRAEGSASGGAATLGFEF